MRVLFIGCVESSYRLLEKLIDLQADVVGVITKEESNFNSDFRDLTPLCEKAGIPTFVVKNINDDESIEFINSRKSEVGFCFGWSQLIKEKVINLFPNGVIGFHPAALPNNRGRHPIIWALALGLKETASTFFMITAGVDEGDIISQVSISIDYEDDAQSLYGKIMDVAILQEEKFLKELEEGTLNRIPQGTNIGNSWRKRSKLDGQIDWRMSSRSIYNLVRALTKPYVGAHFVFNEKEYKVWKVSEISAEGFENIEPGKVISINDDGTIDLKTGEGGVKLIEFDEIEIDKGEYIL